MIRQEIYGYVLTHYAIAALICRAAAEADTGPDRVKFQRTVRIIRRWAADPAFPLTRHGRLTAFRVMGSDVGVRAAAIDR
jgi:hypothetical protein